MRTDMRTPQLIVLSHDAATRWGYQPTDRVISIGSPGQLVFPPQRIVATNTPYCRVLFDDVGAVSQGEHDVHMREDQAEQILTFAEECQREGCSTLIVHCEAGISRSPGVAIALSLLYGWEPGPVTLVQKYPCFNVYVLAMLCKAWQNRTGRYYRYI